jgi:hypothetical protein
MKITTEQKEAIRKVVDYSIEDERTNLEEHIATMWDIDATELEDKELYQMCKEKEVEHIWCELHVLNTLIENKGL